MYKQNKRMQKLKILLKSLHLSYIIYTNVEPY